MEENGMYAEYSLVGAALVILIIAYVAGASVPILLILLFGLSLIGVIVYTSRRRERKLQESAKDRLWKFPKRVELVRWALKNRTVSGIRAEIITSLLSWLDGRLISPVVLDMSAGIGLFHAELNAEELPRFSGLRAISERLNAEIGSHSLLDMRQFLQQKGLRQENKDWAQILKRKRAEEIALLMSNVFVSLLPECNDVPPADPDDLIAKIEAILDDERHGVGAAYYGTPVILANAMTLASFSDAMLDTMDWDRLDDTWRPFLGAAFGVRYREKLVQPNSEVTPP